MSVVEELEAVVTANSSARCAAETGDFAEGVYGGVGCGGWMKVQHKTAGI